MQPLSETNEPLILHVLGFLEYGKPVAAGFKSKPNFEVYA